jgi:CBS domain-containing protein
MLVRELMTKNVITISPEASLKEAGELFKEKRVSGLPVMDEAGKVVGIVTITDMMRILSQIYALKESEKAHEDIKLSGMYEEEKAKAKVKNIMSKSVTVLGEESPIEEVMRLMFNDNIHTIPITNSQGKLVGVIGRRDMVCACF